MRKLLAVWIGAGALLLGAMACGAPAATPTPTEMVGDASTPLPDPTPAESPEATQPTPTLVPSPGPGATADSATTHEATRAVVPTEAALGTDAPDQSEGLESTAAPPPTMTPVEQPPTPVSGVPPTNTPTPAPPPTNTPTAAPPPTATSAPEPTPDLPVGSSVGNRAPEFALTLTEGRTFTSEDLREQGQPVLIFFHSVH